MFDQRRRSKNLFTWQRGSKMADATWCVKMKTGLGSLLVSTAGCAKADFQRVCQSKNVALGTF